MPPVASSRKRAEVRVAPYNGRNGYDGASRYSNILQTMTVVGIALGGVYAGVIAPLHEQINDNSLALKNLRDDQGRMSERVVDKVQFELSKKLSSDEHLEFKLRIDKQIDALRDEIRIIKSEADDLRSQQVTRNEHVTHWDQAKENIAEMRKQIDDLRRDFGGQYTVAEKIKDLQQQLDQMRSLSGTSHVQLTGAPPVPPPRP